MEAAWPAVGLMGATLFGALFYLGSRIDALGARLDARFDGLTGRFDGMEARFDALGARLDARIDTLTQTIAAHLKSHPR